jgi:hypothetical protein
MSDLNAPLTPQQITTAEIQAAHEGYFRRVIVDFDQFVNVATDGLPGETISSRAQRGADAGNEFAKLLTHGLDLIQKSHGREAEAGDLIRAEDVEATEDKALGETHG